jgi:hypothetical protein
MATALDAYEFCAFDSFGQQLAVLDRKDGIDRAMNNQSKNGQSGKLAFPCAASLQHEMIGDTHEVPCPSCIPFDQVACTPLVIRMRITGNHPSVL